MSEPENAANDRNFYATLRAYHPDLPPSWVSEALALSPTSTTQRGTPVGGPQGPRAPLNGWFLATRNLVSSPNPTDHFAFLVDRLRPRIRVLETLRTAGFELDISVYFYVDGSRQFTLPSEQLRDLGDLGLDLWWDVYWVSDD
jgi:hypothetical protein